MWVNKDEVQVHVGDFALRLVSEVTIVRQKSVKWQNFHEVENLRTNLSVKWLWERYLSEVCFRTKCQTQWALQTVFKANFSRKCLTNGLTTRLTYKQMDDIRESVHTCPACVCAHADFNNSKKNFLVRLSIHDNRNLLKLEKKKNKFCVRVCDKEREREKKRKRTDEQKERRNWYNNFLNLVQSHKKFDAQISKEITATNTASLILWILVCGFRIHTCIPGITWTERCFFYESHLSADKLLFLSQ